MVKSANKFWSLKPPKKQRHSLTARLLHWIYAPAVIASAWSGFYISRPRRWLGFRSMDAAIKTAFISSFILAGSYLARIYYGWATGDYREIIPGKQDCRGAWQLLKYELFLTRKKPTFPKYNPLEKLEMSAVALLILVQLVTGLVLYKPGQWRQTSLEARGLNPLRKMHYLAALGITGLVAGHIYFMLTDDPKKLKSIFTGYE
jgi:Ni/Fe-hydrogenase 1 B-type cytochrome subunit